MANVEYDAILKKINNEGYILPKEIADSDEWRMYWMANILKENDKKQKAQWRLESMKCECGSVIYINNQYRHNKSVSHLRFINK